MVKRIPVAGALAVIMLTAAWPASAATTVSGSQPAAAAGATAGQAQPVAPALSLDGALALAEQNNAGLRLALYQMQSSRASLTAVPANTATLAPAAALYARVQFGVTVPESAISPQVTGRQAQISYEQAVVQYYQTKQQVRLGAVQAYVEWQKATALAAAQASGLERALTQEAQVRASYAAGAVARFDLLQAEAQVAGQQASLAGTRAMQGSARQALEQVIGRPLLAEVGPAESLVRADEVKLQEDVAALTARGLANRPDLRDSHLDLTSRRMQTGLVTGSSGMTVLQVQTAAAQYELAVAKARAEVQQTWLAARSALEELKARETALEPAREALRLAELRYQAGVTTYLEVQSALASALQADAARIQAAANLTLQLARLAQATGDL